MSISYGSDYVKKYRGKEKEGRLERLLDLIPLNKDDFVLDIGCGNGFWANLISSKVKKYVGIDTSIDFINESVKNNRRKNCFFVKETSLEHVKKGYKYDKIFMLDVSEHLKDGLFVKILEDVKLMLKSGGGLYIHTPNKKYFLEILKSCGLLKQTYGHIAIRSAEEYVSLLSKNGFKVKIVYLDHYIKVLNVLNILRNIPYVKKYFQARLFIKAWINEN